MKNTINAFLFLLCISLISLNSCKKADSAKPVACLQTDVATAQVAQTINFTSCSTGGASYVWSFGDGQTATTTNASHQYSAAGTYTVTLVVTNADGTDQKTALITVTGATNAPYACIQTSATSINYGDTVTFTSCSTNSTTSLWDFGDGTTASTPVAKHAFTSNHLVTLTVANGVGTDTATVDIAVIAPGRDNFVGTYATGETCTTGNSNYMLTVVANSGVSNALVIGNLGNFGFNVTATVSGYNLTIPAQNVGIYSVSGSGTINGALNTLTISYTVTSSGATDVCTATAIK